MKEKWWEKGSLDKDTWNDFGNEDALTIETVRKTWEILEGTGVGITVYRTPGGIYKAQELSNGTLIRLERIGD